MKIADVIIIGAGAAGLMCAIEVAKRHRKVLLIEHAQKPGKKILMSGGGRCNFTNYQIDFTNYISHNPHFCKSALKRYTQWDFLELVKKYAIQFHEKKHGQLFCNDKSKEILNMLLAECEKRGVTLILNESIKTIDFLGANYFKLKSQNENYTCQSLVIATGGLSIPTLGASAFGYEVAKQFDMKVWPTIPSLVPFTLSQEKEALFELAGISNECIVSSALKKSFHENILFTHKGLSGPAILQISNYWQQGESIQINLLPNIHLLALLKSTQKTHPNMRVKELLGKYIAKRLIQYILDEHIANASLQSLRHTQFEQIAVQLQQWHIQPSGTEGYRTAEVTLGGVDCDALSSQTMESRTIKGLYFVGEVIDVTGWLGGYNFQWAWSSGWVAGQFA